MPDFNGQEPDKALVDEFHARYLEEISHARVSFPSIPHAAATFVPSPTHIRLVHTTRPLYTPSPNLKPSTPNCRVPDLNGQEPDKALVDEFHARYVEEITRLFDTHKAAAGMADRTLKICSS